MMVLANVLDGTGTVAEGGSIWIKIILIVLLLIVLRAFLVQRSLVLAKRLIALSLFIVLVLLVIFPKVSNDIAETIGIGRGADLLFYLSHLFLLLLIVGLWRRSIMLADVITRLTREIALQNASKPQERSCTENKAEPD